MILVYMGFIVMFEFIIRWFQLFVIIIVLYDCNGDIFICNFSLAGNDDLVDEIMYIFEFVFGF